MNVTEQQLREYGRSNIARGVRCVQRGMQTMITGAKPATLLEAHLLTWSVEWPALAFPTVQYTHRAAAALICTAPPREEPRPPWPCFLLRVPSGLIALAGTEGSDDWVSMVIVRLVADRWFHMAFASTCQVHRFGATSDGLLNDLPNEADSGSVPESAFPIPMTTQDDRASACIARLILNTSLAMSDPDAVRPIGKGHAYKGPLVHSPPRVFELGTRRPIKVDCREAVRDYVMGRGRSHLPAVRWLVRGHWRNQAHGPGLQERRKQWIEPHWKGPEDGPTAVRPHVLASRQ